MDFYVDFYTESIDSTSVLFMRRTGAYGPENQAMMGRFVQLLEASGSLGGDAVLLGISLDDPGSTEAQLCRYDVCALDPDDRLPQVPGAGRRSLAGGRYAVFRLAHTAQAVSRAWAQFGPALAEKKLRLDPARPIMERYAKPLLDRGLCELCVPVL